MKVALPQNFLFISHSLFSNVFSVKNERELDPVECNSQTEFIFGAHLPPRHIIRFRCKPFDFVRRIIRSLVFNNPKKLEL